jgi:lipopolysaccharide export system permease protein
MARSFIGPFILTFFIALFVLVMQFLWKYVDELVGKGLDTWVLARLMFYASARLVPMALPLAVLLSSIMVLGDMGEHLELTASRSAGISLLRIMRPILYTVFVISIFAFFFSNNAIPYANLKFSSLMYDIRHQKPAMAIKEGIFYLDIDGFALRVGKKGTDGRTLYNIMVYDHTSNQGNDHVITAEKGEMTQNDQEMAMTLHLEKGEQYKEVAPKQADKPNYEMYHTSFDSWEKKFDLSKFKLSHTDEAFFKDMKQMMTLLQLLGQMDTVKKDRLNTVASFHTYALPYLGMLRTGIDTLPISKVLAPSTIPSKLHLKDYPKKDKLAIYERALTQARNMKNYADIVVKQVEFKDSELMQHRVEIYRKFTLSIACIVLFFIGAPLGSIIRKGGLGWPLFYSILFFILYMVISIIGEKMASRGALSAFTGMWLSTMILIPVGFFLTFKAYTDSQLLNLDNFSLAELPVIKYITARLNSKVHA